VKKVFGPDSQVKIDRSKIVVAGHSFGAITALHAGLRNKEIAAVVSMDPWFFPV
jgi:predicted esterase